MPTPHARRLMLGACTLTMLFGATAAASAPAEPWRLLPWGAGADEVGLLPAAPEQQAIGPTAVATTDSTTFIADGVNGRIVVIPDDGAASTIPTPFRADDLVALGGDALLALDARLDRVHRYAGGAWQSARLAPDARPRGVAAGPDGSSWLIHTNGTATPLFESKALAGAKTATPMGPGATLHAVGRWVDPHRGAVAAWTWGQPAEVKGHGPRLTLTVTTAERLGLVRPIGADRDGNLVVLVETLRDRGALEVRSELRRYTPSGDLTQAIGWTQDGVAPAHRYASVAPSGVVTYMRAGHDGLALYRLAPPTPTHPTQGGVR